MIFFGQHKEKVHANVFSRGFEAEKGADEYVLCYTPYQAIIVSL
jgi:hypothetical protein